MVITVAYDGHMRNTEHIGSNMFITFTIAGFVELPADFLTMLAVERVGRRHTTVWTLIVSGLACFAIAAIPEGKAGEREDMGEERGRGRR